MNEFYNKRILLSNREMFLSKFRNYLAGYTSTERSRGLQKERGERARKFLFEAKQRTEGVYEREKMGKKEKKKWRAMCAFEIHVRATIHTVLDSIVYLVFDELFCRRKYTRKTIFTDC